MCITCIKTQICGLFNSHFGNHCTLAWCTYRHICAVCRGNHSKARCQQGQSFGQLPPINPHCLNGLIGAEEEDTEGEAERILWNANYNNQTNIFSQDLSSHQPPRSIPHQSSTQHCPCPRKTETAVRQEAQYKHHSQDWRQSLKRKFEAKTSNGGQA